MSHNPGTHYDKRFASIDACKPFLFPDNISLRHVDGACLAISPLTANWLVLQGEKDCDRFTILQDGALVGDYLCGCTNEEWHARQRLLGQIIARTFGSQDCVPSLSLDSGSTACYMLITGACNLRCAHCFVAAGRTWFSEMTSAQWCELVTEFAATGGSSITLSGGEPLLKEDWQSVVCQAKKLSMTVTILTNGMLWTERDISYAADWVDEVQVSLDGPSVVLDEAVRGPGHYNKAVECAVALANSTVRTSIAMTPTMNNLQPFVEAFPAFAAGIQERTNNRLFFRLSSKLLPDRHGIAPSCDDARTYEKIMRQLSNQLYPHYSDHNFIISHPPNVGTRNCGLGGLTVAPDGTKYPCNRLRETNPIGGPNDRVDQVVATLWDIEERTSVDNTTPCKQCDLRYICGGGCRLDDYGLERSCSDFYCPTGRKTPWQNTRCKMTDREELLKRMASSIRYWYEFEQ